jgi:heme-degrading monooxygenase HmoA
VQISALHAHISLRQASRVDLWQVHPDASNKMKRKELVMFVRQVTAHFKPGKFDLLNRRLEDDVIPLLKKQTGFRDEISFLDKEKDEAIAMSFWDTEQDAVKYQRDIYPKVSKKMEDAILGTPEVRSFEVKNSTWYDIHAV